MQNLIVYQIQMLIIIVEKIIYKIFNKEFELLRTDDYRE